MNEDPSTTAARVQFLTVDEEWAGQRLDNYLLRCLKGAPKTLVYRIIRSGEVRVNKARAQADTRVAAGDVLRIPPLRLASNAGPAASATASASALAAAPARSFPVVFEDAHLLVIDKPAGVAVHGGSGVSFGVIEQLRRARPEARYLELVHRLDRETSGILLIAKKRSALVALQAQFKARATGKTYLALVQGHWPAKHKVIDQALRKTQTLTASGQEERRVHVVAADHPDAMRAITLVQVLGQHSLPGAGASAVPASLLAVTIKTGRTHQIRVHLAGNQHPILGDDKYGDFALNKTLAKSCGLQRMFLHAWRLQCTHPTTQEPLHLQSPLPQDLRITDFNEITG